MGTRREYEVSKMKINCLGCGFKVDLASAYDDYVGQIKCFACGATMESRPMGARSKQSMP